MGARMRSWCQNSVNNETLNEHMHLHFQNLFGVHLVYKLQQKTFYGKRGNIRDNTYILPYPFERYFLMSHQWPSKCVLFSA